MFYLSPQCWLSTVETHTVLGIFSTTSVDLSTGFPCHEACHQAFSKPLNRYLYIPFNSYHPSHSKRSFIKAEFIRYVRLSSKLLDFLAIKNKFFNGLWNRGYPKWFLLDVFSEVHFDLRWNYLSEKKEKAKVSSHNLFFKTFKNPLFRNLFLYHLGHDFDITICYKATPNLAKFVEC